jgi:hypothetical protein
MSPPTPIIGRLALRVPRGKPAHHLWNNNGTWWVHYSIRHPEGGTRRYRVSLKTPDFETALQEARQIPPRPHMCRQLRRHPALISP